MIITQSQVKNITDTIIHTYQPDKVIIFGSYARGEQNVSDLDIMVISDREKNLQRYKMGYTTRLSLPEPKVPVDILFYTHDEIEKWKNVRLSFVATVLREGMVVYERV